MELTRREVLKILEITTLSDDIIDNVLDLFELETTGITYDKYDAVSICNIYADAETFYHEFLPEYYVQELLDMDFEQLLALQLEYRTIPPEYQYIFVDRYKDRTFKISKYAFYAKDIYGILKILSRSVYLVIPYSISKLYLTSFVSVKSAVQILGFTNLNPNVYHYYLLTLNIRYTYINNKIQYLMEDIINALEVADQIFEQYLPFNEACEIYSYHIMHFLLSFYGASIERKNLEYDIINSDYRYKFGYFKMSAFFVYKKDIEDNYRKWIIRGACNIFSVLLIETLVDGKFECIMDYNVTNFKDCSFINNYQDTVSVFDVKVYGINVFKDPLESYYGKFDTITTKEMFCLWGVEGYNFMFNKLKIKNKRSPSPDTHKIQEYDYEDKFKVQFRNYAFYYLANTLNINNQELKDIFPNRYFIYHYKGINPRQTFELTYTQINAITYLNLKLYIWFDKINFNYKLKEDDVIEYGNNLLINFESHKNECLKQFYTNYLFKIYSIQQNSHYFVPRSALNTFDYEFYTSRYVNSQLSQELSIISRQSGIYNDLIVTSSLNKIELNGTITFQSDIYNDKYLSLEEVIILLRITNLSLNECWLVFCGQKINIIIAKGSIFFKSNEIVQLLKYIENIQKNYLSVSKLDYLLHHQASCGNIKYYALPIEMYYFFPLNNRSFYWVDISVKENIDIKYNNHINDSKFLTSEEINPDKSSTTQYITITLASILLKIEFYNLDKMNSDYKLLSVTNPGYCKKKTVNKLLKLQQQFMDKYVLYDYIVEFLHLKINKFTEHDEEILATLTQYKVPAYIKYIKKYSTIKEERAYLKSDLIVIKSQFHTSIKSPITLSIDNNISGSTPYDTYKTRLNQLQDQFVLGIVTKNSLDLWNKYVHYKLSMSTASTQTFNGQVNVYIRVLIVLLNYLNSHQLPDINLITSGQIARWYDDLESNTYITTLNNFFAYAYYHYQELGIATKYKCSELKNRKPKVVYLNNTIPSIYTFNDYSEIFNFTNNYFSHINLAISEIEESSTCSYASTWFYVIMHLNNAWRSSDITNFPYIDISDIILRNEINDFNWYLNNRLSKAECTIILIRLQNNPKVISKTKKYTRLTCSDELLITFSTLYSLLFLYTKDKFSTSLEYVTHYYNLHNCLSNKLLNRFFYKINIPNFKFKSRKMNKTLLTFVDFMENYYITNNIDISRKHAMLLRSHVSPESTLHYIKHNKETFNTLTNMICARGEFGYAYEMMIKSSLTDSSELSFDDMTSEIRKLQTVIPNINDINKIYSFLNITQRERIELNQYMNTLTLEEIQQKLTKLYINHSSCKFDTHIGCIREHCPKNGNKDMCLSCILHVPTIYSLTTICNSLKDDIEQYSKCNNEISKHKLEIKLIKKSRDLIWAQKKYGNLVLQEILNITAANYDNFLLLINNILKISTKTNNLLKGEDL